MANEQGTEQKQPQAGEARAEQPGILKRVYDLATTQPILIGAAVGAGVLVTAGSLLWSGGPGKPARRYVYPWWFMRMLMAGGWAGLALDAFNEHRGVQFHKLAQWTPIVFAPVGVLLQLAAAAKGPEGRSLSIVSDMLAVPIGIYGQMRHLTPRLQPGLPLKGRLLAAHPPILAPASFAAVGLLELFGHAMADDQRATKVKLSLGRALGRS
ncbi:MAG: hypothetical protein M1319_02675 [Chloroflexi bacterium]|nr:hypothetical protein [Chloroflexota bacterium]